jgi:hypothetical protein
MLTRVVVMVEKFAQQCQYKHTIERSLELEAVSLNWHRKKFNVCFVALRYSSNTPKFQKVHPWKERVECPS